MTSPRSRAVPVARGDELELTIDGLGDGPDGVAHLGRYVVFVPGVLPGERAFVRITSAARKFARGALLAVRGDAADRRAPRCPHFLACGGCHRQHQDYAAQLADKQARVQRAVDHALGTGSPTVLPPVPARPPFGQRHKVVVHLRNAAAGGLEPCFHRRRSPELVTVRECPASDPLAWDLAVRTVELLHELPHRAWDPDFAPHGLLRSVLVRATTLGEAHVVVIARDDRVPGLERLCAALHAAGATTIAVNGNRGEFSQLLGPRTTVLSGPPRIRERLGGIDYLLSPDGFFQTSPQAAGHLVEAVVAWLAPTRADDVADLYCGGGLLTLPLARTARTAWGVELSPTSVHDAQASAQASGVANVQFRVGQVDDWLRACAEGRLPRPRLVALDPPRDGIGPGVVEGLRALRPARLAYVSCEPEALQRDLAALQAAGFTTRSVLPLDMFPQTSHVESLACLERSP